MVTIEEIRKGIQKLYDAEEKIHVSINMTHPKLVVHNVPAEIKGVYTNLFIIEERDCGYPRIHSLSYSDVLIKQIEIHELKIGKENF